MNYWGMIRFVYSKLDPALSAAERWKLAYKVMQARGWT